MKRPLLRVSSGELVDYLCEVSMKASFFYNLVMYNLTSLLRSIRMTNSRFLWLRVLMILTMTGIAAADSPLFAQTSNNNTGARLSRHGGYRREEKPAAGMPVVMRSNWSPDPTVTRYLDVADTALSALPQRYIEAERAYRFVIHADPKDLRGYFGLARVFSEQRKYSAAADVYRRAVTVSPDAPEVRFNLGLVYIKLHNKENALNQVRVLQRLRSDLATVLLENINQK
jgi:tetratricopeptide (TPR) repeat protein